MSALGVTFRGAVDIWDCDQMQHMSVRIYGRHFSSAERIALGSARRELARDELSFHREIRLGSPIRIETEAEADAVLVHRLFDGESDTPSATLRSIYGPPGPAAEVSTGWTETGLTVIRPAECEDGQLDRETMIRLGNHASMHLGLDRHRLRDASGALTTGSATVASTMARHAAIPAGTPIRIESRLGDTTRRSLRIHHRLRHATSQAPLAAIETTAVFFDMATRRAIQLPAALGPREPHE